MKTIGGFDISFAFVASVPVLEEDNTPLQVKMLTKESKTTAYLFKIFDAALDKGRTEIAFESDGKQGNDVRNHLLSIAVATETRKKSHHAKRLAVHLQEQTDQRNGKGLFVIMIGKKARSTRIVLLRFKGDEGLYNHGKTLNVDYIPEVFTKRSQHYKLAVYEDMLSSTAFWKGFSVDKQIAANTYKTVSLFWVEKFLLSKTALTPAQGTLEFSKVIKNILAQTKDLDDQEAIITGVMNLRSKKNIQTSLSSFCETYLSPELTKKIKEQINNDFFNSVFEVNGEVYQKELGKTVLTIQDGIIAFVPTFQYPKHVKERLDGNGQKYVTIEGKLRGKKINVEQQHRSKK
jgi:hypothetical protein